MSTPTPPQYAAGAVKQDPVTLAAAVRTTMPSADGAMDWGVMTVSSGGHHSGYDGVAAWTDIPTTGRKGKK